MYDEKFLHETKEDRSGARLEALIRDNLGIKKAEFLRKTGINPSQLHKIIKGDGDPGFDTCQRIVKSFPEVSLSWLISGIGDWKITDDNELQLIRELRSLENNNERMKNLTVLRTAFREEEEYKTLSKELAFVEGITEEIKEIYFGRLIKQQMMRRSIWEDYARDNAEKYSKEWTMSLQDELYKQDSNLKHVQIDDIIHTFCKLKREKKNLSQLIDNKSK